MHVSWALSLALVLAIVSLARRPSVAEGFMSSDSCTRPRLVDALLSPEECTAIITAAETAGMFRSFVSDPNAPVSAHRTSFQTFLPLDHLAVAPVVEKVERLTGRSRVYFEDMQVVRYTSSQKYDAHFDTDDSTLPQDVRTDTVLMYLNDDFAGGETGFPTARMTVTPQTGLGVWWKNIDAQGGILPCGFHAGKPVTTGTKYACTIWVRRIPFPRETNTLKATRA